MGDGEGRAGRVGARSGRSRPVSLPHPNKCRADASARVDRTRWADPQASEEGAHTGGPPYRRRVHYGRSRSPQINWQGVGGPGRLSASPPWRRPDHSTRTPLELPRRSRQRAGRDSPRPWGFSPPSRGGAAGGEASVVRPMGCPSRLRGHKPAPAEVGRTREGSPVPDRAGLTTYGRAGRPRGGSFGETSEERRQRLFHGSLSSKCEVIQNKVRPIPLSSYTMSYPQEFGL